jgi:hypothetical protein
MALRHATNMRMNTTNAASQQNTEHNSRGGHLSSRYPLSSLSSSSSLQQAQWLLALAHVLHGPSHLNSSSSRSLENEEHSFDALPPLMECIHLCEQHGFDSLLAEAHMLVSQLYSSMDRSLEAIAALEMHLPHVMEHGSLQLQSQYFLALAKAHCRAAAASKDVHLDENRRDHSSGICDHERKSLEWLEQSLEAATIVEDVVISREVAYLQAHMYDRIGQVQAREVASKTFLSYDRQVEHAKCMPVESIHCLSGPDQLLHIVNLRLAE